jgi:hypothetical protein
VKRPVQRNNYSCPRKLRKLGSPEAGRGFPIEKPVFSGKYSV